LVPHVVNTCKFLSTPNVAFPRWHNKEGRWASCPRAQQAKGHKIASPKLCYDYDYKSEASFGWI